VLHAARRAAEVTWALRAYDTSAEFLGAALEALAESGERDDLERARLQVRLFGALGRRDDLDRARTLATAAIPVLDAGGAHDEADRARLELAQILAMHACHSEALPHLDAILSRRGAAAGIDAFTAWVLAERAVARDLSGHPRELRSTGERLLEAGRALRSPELRERGLMLLRNWTATQTVELDRALRLSRRL